MFLKYIHDPMLYQLRNKNTEFFEGWYFKQVASDLRTSISIIPGISKSSHASHAFIQTIISTNVASKQKLETHYHKFSIDEFICSDTPFCLKLGKCVFKREELELELKDATYSIHGKIAFSNFTKINTSLVSPSIMGYYAYFPFLECYHGIISMDHLLMGALTINDKTVDFSHGKGYIEKDWGTSFPKSYVWLQCNSFEHSNISIMCSIANVPFAGTSFRGFICNLTIDSREYRFASYNYSKLVTLNYFDCNIEIVFIKGDLKLELSAKMSEGGILKAPQNGIMNNTIKEGLSGVVDVNLIKKSGEVLFKGTGHLCGIELVNNP